MIQFDEHMFQMGWWNHQLVVYAEAVYILLPTQALTTTNVFFHVKSDDHLLQGGAAPENQR